MAEDPEMLGYRRLPILQCIDDFADRPLAERQKAENLPTSWLRDGVKRIRRCSGSCIAYLYIPISAYVKRLT